MKLKALFKVIGLALAMALLSVVASLQTILSSEPFKQQLSRTLSRTLRGEVLLGAITLDFTRGLEVGAIQWRQNGVPRLLLQRMTLDIAWTDLLHGQLTIREIRLSNGRVAAFREEPESPTTPPEAPPVPGGMVSPRFSPPPIQVEMRSLALEKIDLEFALSPTRTLKFDNLSLRSALRITARGIDLTGGLTVDDVSYTDGTGRLAAPLALDFDLGGDLDRQGLQTRRSELRLGENFKIPLTIQVRTDRDPIEIRVSADSRPLELAPLLALLRPWLEPGILALQGRVTPGFTLAGTWRDDGFHGAGSGELALDQLQGKLPGFQAALENGSGGLRLAGIEIRGNTWERIVTESRLAATGFTFEGLRGSDLSWLMVLNHTPDGRLDGHARLRAARLAPEKRGGEAFPPFMAHARVTGQPGSGALGFDPLIVRAGELMKLVGRGEVEPDPESPGGLRLDGRLRAELDGAGLMRLLPEPLKKGLGARFEAGISRFQARGAASLDDQWMPRRLRTRGAASLRPFALVQENGGLRAEVRSASLYWRAGQPLPGEPVEGRLRASANLGPLHLGQTASADASELDFRADGRLLPAERRANGTIALRGLVQGVAGVEGFRAERMRTALDAELSGELTPEGAWRPLTLQETLTGRADAVTLTREEERWRLPALTIALKGQSDLQAGEHRLERVDLQGERLFTATLSGGYREGTTRYELSGALEPEELAGVGETLGLRDRPWFARTGAAGRVGMKFDASGTLAALTGTNGGALPFSGSLQVTGRDMAGRWETGRIEGGGGTLQLRLQPERQDLVALTANLKAERLLLALPRTASAKAGPLPATLELELTGQGMDALTVNRLRATLPGLLAEAQGKLFGAARLVRGSGGSLSERLAPLFVKLTGRAGVDLAAESQLLPAMGMRGQGRNELTLALSKPANGPFSIALENTLEKVSLQQGHFALNGASGRVDASKTLWPSKAAVPEKPKARRVFSLDRIAASPAWEENGRHIRIESLEAGGVRMEEIGFDASFLEESVRLRNLEMRLLGGTVVGNLVLEGVKPGRIDGVLEGAGVDLNRLLPDAARISGESSVDFVSRHALRFDKESGRMNWNRSAISLVFTRIGREAIDHLLLSLDPGESNPALLNARTKVAMANPASLDLQLTRGMINLKIVFQEGLVSALNIERIPLGVLGRFEQIRQQTLPLENLIRLLEQLGTPHLEIAAHDVALKP